MRKLILMLILCFAFTGCKLQTRAFARLTGSALQLELPKDFSKPISFSSGRKGEIKTSGQDHHPDPSHR